MQMTRATDQGTGLSVKPKRGNGVFWNNMLPNGTGDPRVIHAGLPVKSGVKIGMNMFSYYYLNASLVGGEWIFSFYSTFGCNKSGMIHEGKKTEYQIHNYLRV